MIRLKLLACLSVLVAIVYLPLGCTYLKVNQYDRPILLTSNDQVTLRYTYAEVTIIAPIIIIDAQPSAYRLSIYDRRNPAEALLQRVFFPGDSIKLILPLNILNSEPLGNQAVLLPLGGDYLEVQHTFTVTGTQRIELPLFKIQRIPYILSGNVYRRADQLPIRGAEVVLADSQRILGTSVTDAMGFYRLQLRAAQGERTDLKLTVNTGGDLPKLSISLQFGPEHEVRKDLYLGPPQEFLEKGVPYRVTENLVPFRKGPENGSPVHFFLSQGDLVVISKVAGDRLFGHTEIRDETRDIAQEVEGWVLRRYVTPIMKKEKRKDVVSEIKIPSAQTETYPVTTVRSSNFVATSFSSVPLEAEVILDSVLIGITPLVNYPVEIGDHTVTIQKEDYAPVKKTIQIQPAEALAINVKLNPLYQVKFFSKEDNLEFELDNEYRWQENKIQLMMEKGNHNLQVYQLGELVDAQIIPVNRRMKIIYELVEEKSTDD